MSLVFAFHHLFAIYMPLAAGEAETVPGEVAANIGQPILVVCEVLVPATIAVSSIHKLMEHRESAVTMCIELVVKGGGTLLALELIRHMLAG
jgi:hypothetical protein